ncbi:recombinase family protein [Flavobacterium microcysteis]|uniref:Recombinase family protein n=1 Tax=Flavobacterium microcysteis TaxID=2596891 RepID=A0A501QFX0_9FLAO|nr:recombinase family protein [Flavobacterium microcysteis]TPD71284.1 recombinase family protein [Flavobacterium microcysteis]
MTTAILYIRVSTDEQAIRGYSQRYQREHLEQYCISNNIDVIDVIFEDYSARNFERPGWKILMTELRIKKYQRPNFILFTKWDRFSRNVGDAYYVISQLYKMGISPQAIDQKLDLSIPENKIILSVYLATSEAENDRRSMNVKEGIHKAKEEGRWTAHIPLGYTAILLPDNKRGIHPKEPEATFIRQAFDMVLERTKSVKAIYDQLGGNLKCSINTFRRILCNPLYCGKIFVPEFKEQNAHLTDGLHKGIVDESKFLKVQGILNKKTSPVKRSNLDEYMILRGFLFCPQCDKKLTGSLSKGKIHHYAYYHCNSKCGFRLRADKINSFFKDELKTLELKEDYIDLCFKFIIYTCKDIREEKISNDKVLSQSIEKLVERILKAKLLLLHDEIDYDDYILIKKDCENKIHGFGKDFKSIPDKNKFLYQRINNIIKSIHEIGISFEQAETNTQKKMLCLLLNQHIILNKNLAFKEVLNPIMLKVFRTKSSSFKFVELLNLKLKLPTEFSQLVDEIMAIESKNDNTVSKESAQEIACFLIGLIKIIHNNNRQLVYD